jgi:Trk K+ transport system NAD-binding subunit
VWREWCFTRFVLRQFRGRFLFIAAIVLGGAVAFQRLEPDKAHSPWQAVYFTWLLIFGQPPEALPDSLALKLLFFAMPILGLTVIIESIVEFSHLVRDRRRNERSWCSMMAATLSDHIIIVGLGKLGYRTFQMLRRLGEPVVVIERDEDNQFLDEIRHDGCPLLIGDARRESLLADANVAGARSIILASNDDLANLEVALDARRLKPGIRVVLRMFDQNMADKIRDGFNIHIAMSQSAMSAPSFAMAALDRSIVSSFVIDNELMVVKRCMVGPSGALDGRTVLDVMRSTGLMVLRHRRQDGDMSSPSPDTRLAAGDEVMLQGTYDALERFERRHARVA